MYKYCSIVKNKVTLSHTVMLNCWINISKRYQGSQVYYKNMTGQYVV